MIVVLPLHWPIRFDLNRQPLDSSRNVAVVRKNGQNDSVDAKRRARDSWYLVEFVTVALQDLQRFFPRNAVDFGDTHLRRAIHTPPWSRSPVLVRRTANGSSLWSCSRIVDDVC